MKLELTFLKHVKASLLLIMIFLVIIFIIYYIGLNAKNSLYIILPMFILLILPTLYVHLNYYNEGKGFVYELNKDEIKVINDNGVIIFHKENFKKIEIYMSGTRLAGLVIRNFPFEDYYYAKIIMNDGKEIIISCLFSKKIDKILPSLYGEIPLVKIKDFYPII
ncbi:hypothetical protein [Flavobacterium sp. 140616W15]|uniref:hypothetical protein n=1 Tax=Flavobacterium sp. 140616W15 TaxID=2478552 RepID=UPI000F0C3824|nr:hypothetical protein [Flavobacterium sp. 140616W15]AYN03974.1 hypothetical protein EAG11_07035 [Flavobacterium sp. 140616W15]